MVNPRQISEALKGEMSEEQIAVLLTDPHLEEKVDDDDEIFIPEGDEYF